MWDKKNRTSQKRYVENSNSNQAISRCTQLGRDCGIEPKIVSGYGIKNRDFKGAFVWDQSGIRIIGIMQVSVCLGAILIPEYLDSILAILLPGAE